MSSGSRGSPATGSARLPLVTEHPRGARSHSYSPPGRKVESGRRSAQVPPTGGAWWGGMRKSRAGFRRRHGTSRFRRAGRRGAAVSGPPQVMLQAASCALSVGHRGLASCVGRWRGDGVGEEFVQGTLSSREPQQEMRWTPQTS